jgi:hypothetical protein
MQNLKLFIKSAGIMFFITGIAKIIGAFGSTVDLPMQDPIFHFQFRQLMFWVGVIELVIVPICFFEKTRGVALTLTAWMATNYLFYQLGLMFLHWQRPCVCMGYLTEGLKIPPWLGEWISKMLVIYLLIGSYGMLFWLWRQRKRVIPTSLSQQ